MLNLSPLPIPDLFSSSAPSGLRISADILPKTISSANIKAGICNTFVQDNQSYSAAPGTLRGLHFQTAPFAQAKLVRVLRGKIRRHRRFAALVGQLWPALPVELSADGGEQLFVPRVCPRLLYFSARHRGQLQSRRGLFGSQRLRPQCRRSGSGDSVAGTAPRQSSDKDRALPMFKQLPEHFH